MLVSLCKNSHTLLAVSQTINNLPSSITQIDRDLHTIPQYIYITSFSNTKLKSKCKYELSKKSA